MHDILFSGIFDNVLTRNMHYYVVHPVLKLEIVCIIIIITKIRKFRLITSSQRVTFDEKTDKRLYLSSADSSQV